MLNVSAVRQQNTAGKHRRSPLWLRVLIPFFLVVFFVGGIFSGYALYVTLRDVVAHIELPSLPVLRFPSISLPKARASESNEEVLPTMGSPDAQGSSENLPVAPPAAASIQAGDRINILLLGLNRSKNATAWGYLTDTIIVVTIDPTNKTAGMLSIPRDLQLPILGYGEDRINTANVTGYTNDYPGGGPALLERTIEASFGVPINYYVMVDFSGFAKIIDAVGGVDIDVAQTLHDTKYPDPLPEDPYHYTTVHFDPGLQHMDGVRALQYARSRMSTTDFDRAARQQQLLKAIQEKALGLGLITKLPALAASMKGSFKTDMAVQDMIQLASLAPQIDMGDLKQVVLGKPYVYGYKRPSDGASIQLPKWDLIEPLTADLFGTPLVVVQPTAAPALPTPAPTLAPVEIEGLQELAREGARIALQNGTTEPNYAARVAARLIEQGFQVVEFGDADRVDYANTVIVDYTGKVYTLQRLVEEFGVAAENVRTSPNLRSEIDIRVIVGQDYRETFR
jgi:LCP family protein required for cell wall assembly